MKRGRGMLIGLALVFAALAALTFYQQSAGIGVPPTQEPRFLGRVFPDLAVLDMLAIRLRSPEREEAGFIIARDAEGAWVAPDGTPIDPATASSIARTIALLPYQRTVTPADGDLRGFGFLPRGFFAVEVALIDGGSAVVEIGDLAPSNVGYYAVANDQPQVYLLDRPAVDYLIQQYQTRAQP